MFLNLLWRTSHREYLTEQMTITWQQSFSWREFISKRAEVFVKNKKNLPCESKLGKEKSSDVMKLLSMKTGKKNNKVSKLDGNETCILKFRKEKQSEFSWNSVYTSTFSRLKTGLAGLYWSFDIKARRKYIFFLLFFPLFLWYSFSKS